MQYFKIDGYDISSLVSGLTISKQHNYNSQTNAAGNRVVDYINTKYTITVSFIPLNISQMMHLNSLISNPNVSVSYLQPGTLNITTIDCLLDSNEVEYYTIQSGASDILFKPFDLTFEEL